MLVAVSSMSYDQNHCDNIQLKAAALCQFAPTLHFVRVSCLSKLFDISKK